MQILAIVRLPLLMNILDLMAKIRNLIARQSILENREYCVICRMFLAPTHANESFQLEFMQIITDCASGHAFMYHPAMEHTGFHSI